MKQKRNIFKKRIAVFGFIIAAAVFASFFGGSFSYALFYASLAIPVTCLIYLFFVIAKLKIHQSIDSKIVVKGEKIGYNFKFTNESSVYFTSVKAEFISDYSKVDLNKYQHEISLAPGQKSENETELICLYRGEYKVGVKSVIVKDYLELFSIKFNAPSTVNMRVYPRVFKLNSLSALNFGEEIKSLPFTYRTGEEQDTDLRSFTFGDSIKTVNWKASAKHQELLTRRRIEPEKEKITIFIDTAPIEEYKRIPLEDKALEIALSVADYYLSRKIETEIIYPTVVLNRIQVSKYEDFRHFYDACLTLPFRCGNADEYFRTLNLKDATVLILITTEPKAFLSGLQNFAAFTHSCVILTGNRENDELSGIRRYLGKTALIHIPEDAELSDILN
ncbi:MAG: DUF58 domain-containing protein [Oscillospiraceae bacterium]|nr:DUF58 domain-containing protein [Oscillospiraceae bacterium]